MEVKQQVKIALNPEKVDQTKEYYLGPMDVVCRYCGALFFKGELQSCCKGGQLCSVLLPKLLAFEDLPHEFRQLYDSQSELSKEFFEKIRILNSVFSFTSLGISRKLTRQEAIQINSSLGGYSVVIHGQIFHQISPLMPRDGTKRTGSQVLFYDSHWEELDRRGELCMSNKAPVSKELLELIQSVLHQYNELYKMYKPIGLKAINDTNAVSMVIVDDFRKIQIKLTDQKLYARPSVKDTAVLIADKGETGFSRDIVIQKKDSKLQRISESHPANDPLAYSLIFVKGDLGWSPEMTYPARTISQPSIDRLASDSTEESEDLSVDEYLDACYPETTRVSVKTKLIRLTLFMFMNFFLHVRKEAFNLMFKCKFKEN